MSLHYLKAIGIYKSSLVLMGLTLCAFNGWAEQKIAVLNYQAALLESKDAKAYAAEAEKKFGLQLKQVQSIEVQAQQIKKRLESTSPKLTDAERERLQLDFRQKARDFQARSQELTKAKAVSDQSTLDKIKPKLDKAVRSIVTAGNFDLVLESNAAVFFKPDLDITGQVIEKMNSN